MSAQPHPCERNAWCDYPKGHRFICGRTKPVTFGSAPRVSISQPFPSGGSEAAP